MKIRFLVPALVLAAQIAGGTTFNLPKDASLFSIALPDDWQTEESSGGLASRPRGDNKFVVNLFSLPAVHTHEAAMSAAVDRVKPTVQQFTAGEVKRDIEAGIAFFGMSAKGTKDGAPMRITLMVFASDAEHYFGLSLMGEEASLSKYGDAHDHILESIRPLRHLKTEVEPGIFAFGFPDENPAFMVKVPSAYPVKTEANQFVASAKNGLSTLRIAPVPLSEAMLLKSDDSKGEWVKRKAEEIVKTDRLKGFVPGSSGSEHVAGHWGHMIKYTGPFLEELISPFAVCLFTPDGQHYYYACWESRDETANDQMEWGLNVIGSIKSVTR
jgi:hypothetical protein